ncbi:MAG: hypothetical protein O3B74_00880 [Proteobacteria bacterium]|nr:hypothetical protein [Pseudomonadota bacterium]MDA1310064.1 hypothetical protein [Pseudomonadota bacterium]
MTPTPNRSRRAVFLRDVGILLAVVAVIGGALWAARALCRASADCPWTILY